MGNAEFLLPAALALVVAGAFTIAAIRSLKQIARSFALETKRGG
jgi:hypothetical protein